MAAERLYLILDSKGTPLANAVLESPPNSEVLQIRILGGKEEAVAAHREIQLIGMDDSTPNRVGVIIRQRDDKMVIQPTAALGPAARAEGGGDAPPRQARSGQGGPATPGPPPSSGRLPGRAPHIRQERPRRPPSYRQVP